MARRTEAQGETGCKCSSMSNVSGATKAPVLGLTSHLLRVSWEGEVMGLGGQQINSVAFQTASRASKWRGHLICSSQTWQGLDRSHREGCPGRRAKHPREPDWPRGIQCWGGAALAWGRGWEGGGWVGVSEPG
jgi:hypothetical protein